MQICSGVRCLSTVDGKCATRGKIILSVDDYQCHAGTRRALLFLGVGVIAGVCLGASVIRVVRIDLSVDFGEGSVHGLYLATCPRSEEHVNYRPDIDALPTTQSQSGKAVKIAPVIL